MYCYALNPPGPSLQDKSYTDIFLKTLLHRVSKKKIFLIIKHFKQLKTKNVFPKYTYLFYYYYLIFIRTIQNIILLQINDKCGQ